VIYKELGNTGKEISAIGFGCGIGGVKAATADYTGLYDSLKKSLNLGVNFIDTSPVYGNGESEEIVGKVIRDCKNRENLIVGTKVLPGKTDYAGVMNSVEHSLSRLKVDYIDLYQVHWPNPSIPMEETVSAMEELIRQGKILHFGVSNFSFSEIQRVSSSLKENPLSSVQVEYNFCERSIENNILPFCQKNDTTVIAYTPLMRGRLAGSAEQIKLLETMAQKYCASIAQVILAWITKIPSVIVLSNTKNLQRVDENFSASDIEMSIEDHETISKACIPPIERVSTKFILESSNLSKTGYGDMKEALNNKMEWSPSPQELSKQMKRGEFLKPIRLRKILKDGKPGLELLEGKLRFWAWVVAFGWDKEIPSIIWES